MGDRLLIPRTGTICEDLFRLAHDLSGHFGADKSYATLRDAYYWPNMRRDLETSYILPVRIACKTNHLLRNRPVLCIHSQSQTTAGIVL
jgi:hypothetical protein